MYIVITFCMCSVFPSVYECVHIHAGVMLGVKPRASILLDKCSATEIQMQPSVYLFIQSQGLILQFRLVLVSEAAGVTGLHLQTWLLV